jgi:Mrp family chromosome partitioning ATPase
VLVTVVSGLGGIGKAALAVQAAHAARERGWSPGVCSSSTCTVTTTPTPKPQRSACGPPVYRRSPRTHR